MKLFSIAIVFLGLFCTAFFAFGDDARQTHADETRQWSVRVEVLMVAVPQEKAFSSMAELRDPAKIDAATARLLEAISRKQAILTGYTTALAQERERAYSETFIEQRYVTDWNPMVCPMPSETPSPSTTTLPVAPQPLPKTVPRFIEVPIPTVFEVKNTGTKLQFEAEVQSNGEWLQLNAEPERVLFLGFDTYDSARLKNGVITKRETPIYDTAKTSASLTLRNGRRSLIAVHLLTKPANYVEFFILQAWATPTR